MNDFYKTRKLLIVCYLILPNLLTSNKVCGKLVENNSSNATRRMQLDEGNSAKATRRN